MVVTICFSRKRMPLTPPLPMGSPTCPGEPSLMPFPRCFAGRTGGIPNGGVDQLGDYLSTITTVTRIDEDEFTQTQKEKVRLLDEYQDDIDALFEAAETLRQQAVEEWPALFLAELDDGLWTDEWHYRYEGLSGMGLCVSGRLVSGR